MPSGATTNWPGRDLHALGHEIVVRRRQRERQQDGNRQRRRGFARSRLGLCLGQGSLCWFRRRINDSAAHSSLLARAPFIRVDSGIASLAEDSRRRPDIWGRLTSARRSRAGSLISAVERQLAANTAEAYERDISQFLAFFAGKLNKLPDMKQLLALQARDVRALSCGAARRRRRQPEPVADV